MSGRTPRKTAQSSSPSRRTTQAARTNHANHANHAKTQNDSGFPWKKVGGILVIVLVIFLVIFLIFENRNLKHSREESSSSDEIESVLESLGAHMLLPINETPTLATVTDSTALRSEPFFSKSKNGDKVVVYQDAKKAILYRPDLDIIIEVAPLTQTQEASAVSEDLSGVAGGVSEVDNLDSQNTQPAPQVVSESLNLPELNQLADEAPSEDAPLEKESRNTASEADKGNYTIALYNGTTTLGYTYKLEQQLAVIENLDIRIRENAQQNTYTKTVVVDVGGKSGDMAQKIADILNASVEALPPGEVQPDVDVIIIGGQE